MWTITKMPGMSNQSGKPVKTDNESNIRKIMGTKDFNELNEAFRHISSLSPLLNVIVKSKCWYFMLNFECFLYTGSTIWKNETDKLLKKIVGNMKQLSFTISIDSFSAMLSFTFKITCFYMWFSHNHIFLI